MSKLFESPADEIARVIFVRHGRTNKNIESRIGARDNSDLDETGLRQAQLAAKRLRDFPIRRIYASPVLRARHTAGIIADELELPVVETRDLTEYDFGIISGLTMAEINQKYPDIYADLQDWIYQKTNPNRPRPVIPGEETFAALETRAARYTDMITEKHQGETVLAVTHLGVIKACIAAVFGCSIQQSMNYIAFNTSLTVIDFLRKRPILMAFNDTRHLEQQLNYGNITLF